MHMSRQLYLEKIKIYCDSKKDDKGRNNLVYNTFYDFIKELIWDRGFDHEMLDSFDLYPTSEDIKTDDLSGMYWQKLYTIAERTVCKNYSLKGYLLACGLEKQTIVKYINKVSDKFELFQSFQEILDKQDEEIFGIFNNSKFEESKINKITLYLFIKNSDNISPTRRPCLPILS